MEEDMLCKPGLPVHLSHRRGAITRRVRRIVVRVRLLVDEISQEGVRDLCSCCDRMFSPDCGRPILLEGDEHNHGYERGDG